MEIKSFNEWVLENPGKSINDYYKMTGSKPVSSAQPLQLSTAVSTPISLNVKISSLRLFLYTGIVMASFILWSILFLIIVYGLGGGIIKHLLLNLSGQSA